MLPGIDLLPKAHLSHNICQPTILYGSECINLCNAMTNKLNSVQSTSIKNAWGLAKQFHHSNLLEIGGICSVDVQIQKQTLPLFKTLL